MSRRAALALLLAIGCTEAERDNESGTDTAVASGGSEDADIPCDQCDDDESCHSQAPLGHCVCDPGYEWVDPENDADFTCMPIPPRGTADDCIEDNSHADMGMCFCDAGFNWCTDDAADLTCCADPAQASEDTN